MACRIVYLGTRPTLNIMVLQSDSLYNFANFKGCVCLYRFVSWWLEESQCPGRGSALWEMLGCIGADFMDSSVRMFEKQGLCKIEGLAMQSYWKGGVTKQKHRLCVQYLNRPLTTIIMPTYWNIMSQKGIITLYSLNCNTSMKRHI